jgi:hypothetical protein
MRVVAIDPGSAKAGALCCAIPPTADQIVFYAEVMLRDVDALKLAKEVQHLESDVKFEAFIIDARAGKQHSMGRSDTIAEHYEREFEAIGLKSRSTGHGFEWGCTDPDTRESALKMLMRNGPDGQPILRVMRHLVQFDRQMESIFYSKHDYRRRDDKGKVTELVHCAEYLAAYFATGLYYVAPAPLVDAPKKLTALEVVEKMIGPSRRDPGQFYG